MHKKIVTIFMFCAGILLCALSCGHTQSVSEPSAADDLRKEKEALVERLRVAQMESAMLLFEQK